jgi:Periplasmic component of the Tol biopolymer transport system
MNKRFYPLLVFLVLVMMGMACALPFGGAPSPSADEVGTVVALTFQALTPVSEGPTATPEPAAGLLPRSLYYLGTDDAGLTQIFRIDRDGTTRHQVTSETVNAGNFDVSPVDGSVAYVVNNQLLLINSDGSGRRVLVDGDPLDENAAFLNNISNPVFSPNGQTLAYGHQGLNFYALSTGVTNRVIENQIDNVSGIPFPKELYSPDQYSPDGSKLLLSLGHYEGASAAIYYPDSKALVRLNGGEGSLICCGNEEWTADSSTFYAANPSFGMFLSGMWRVDAATGTVTQLLPSEAGGGMYNIPDEPFLAPDGQLYYFFAQVAAPDGFVSRAPLKIVRSAPDGVTGRTNVVDEEFNLMNEALWAPDASIVIVAIAPTEEVYQGGQAEIVYLDGRPGVELTSFAQQMKWGP